MPLLTRADMLAAKLPHRDVPVPELGQDAVVRVQQMSVNTRAAFFERIRLHNVANLAWEDDQDKPEDERENVAKPDDLDTALLSIINSIVDEDGKLLFAEADMPIFNEWSNNAVTRIYEAVVELNNYDRSLPSQVQDQKKG